MGYKNLGQLCVYVAKKCGFVAGPCRKFTAHSTRRMANTVAYQDGATERQRQKRFKYAAGSTAMRNYEAPAPADIRAENLATFGLGPKLNTTAPAPVPMAPVPMQPQISAFEGTDEFGALDLFDLGEMDLDQAFDQLLMNEKRNVQPAPVSVSAAAQSTVHVIDMRGNTGHVTLNFGTSSERPHVIN